MVIFHSYVSLPEGTTQFQKREKTTILGPEHNLVENRGMVSCNFYCHKKFHREVIPGMCPPNLVETCGNIGSSDSSEAASATARSALHHQRPQGAYQLAS
jgi:hypothetical protein